MKKFAAAFEKNGIMKLIFISAENEYKAYQIAALMVGKLGFATNVGTLGIHESLGYCADSKDIRAVIKKFCNVILKENTHG